jgi:hypothetical protein
MKSTIVSACVLVLSLFHGAMAAPAVGVLQSSRACALVADEALVEVRQFPGCGGKCTNPNVVTEGA